MEEESNVFDNLIGSKSFVNRIKAFAHAAGKSGSPVLIEGETGTGKSMAAQLIYQSASELKKKFHVVPLGEMPEDLMESQLFGYEKGAFTGAAQAFTGQMLDAHGGTIVLEEIDSLPVHLQHKILRLVESNEFLSLGSSETKSCNVRVIATANQDLKQLVDEKKFRSDLYFRLKVLHLHLPPLRDRKEDVSTLLSFYAEHFAKQYDKPTLEFNEDSLRALVSYAWPGNVRELKAEVERLYVLQQLRSVSLYDLSEEINIATLINPDLCDGPLKSEFEGKGWNERQRIINCLHRNKWNKTDAAKEMGISRKHLYSLMKKYSLN